MTDLSALPRFLDAGLAGLKSLVTGAEPAPREHGRKVTAGLWALVAAGAAYLAYGAMTYLDRKSGLPLILCLAGGVALAGPFVLLVKRPLLAWRLAWITAIGTGAAVQAHGRTPFSWHPAVFVMQVVILVVLARRLPVATSFWAWVSMAVLICVSFYPADRVSLIVIVAGLMAIPALIRREPARGQVRVGQGRRTAER